MTDILRVLNTGASLDVTFDDEEVERLIDTSRSERIVDRSQDGEITVYEVGDPEARDVQIHFWFRYPETVTKLLAILDTERFLLWPRYNLVPALRYEATLVNPKQIQRLYHAGLQAARRTVVVDFYAWSEAFIMAGRSRMQTG